jgi:hypothetical protein
MAAGLWVDGWLWFSGVDGCLRFISCSLAEQPDIPSACTPHRHHHHHHHRLYVHTYM